MLSHAKPQPDHLNNPQDAESPRQQQNPTRHNNSSQTWECPDVDKVLIKLTEVLQGVRRNQSQEAVVAPPVNRASELLLEEPYFNYGALQKPGLLSLALEQISKLQRTSVGKLFAVPSLCSSTVYQQLPSIFPTVCPTVSQQHRTYMLLIVLYAH